MAFKAGDVVFTEAGTMGASRRLIQAVSSGSRTVHVGVATGTANFQFESVTGGLGIGAIKSTDGCSVFRHKSLSVQNLIAIIAEGYVAEVANTGGGYGSYSRTSAAATGVAGTRGGEQQQWGNTGVSSSFYCSNFVARVLLAAKQAGGQYVFNGNIQVHMLPYKLKEKLVADVMWAKI